MVVLLLNRDQVELRELTQDLYISSRSDRFILSISNLRRRPGTTVDMARLLRELDYGRAKVLLHVSISPQQRLAARARHEDGGGTGMV